MKLALETNQRRCLDVQLHLPAGNLLMITAPLGGDCWLFRVKLAKNLVLVAVPVFGGVNIHQQSKGAEDYFMPCESSATKIENSFRAHLKNAIPADIYLEAIGLLQLEVKRWRGLQPRSTRRSGRGVLWRPGAD
jgi:hypothetical protein